MYRHVKFFRLDIILLSEYGVFEHFIFDTSHCNVLTTHHDIAAVIYEDECFDDFSNHWQL